MKILATDAYGGKQRALTGKFDMVRAFSADRLPFLLIEEWGGKAMSHTQWMLDGCEVVEIAEEEQDFFNRWRSALVY